MNINGIDITEIIEKIQYKYPEFTEVEISQLCEDYISNFPKKTKLESIIKSLNKYITKEFALDEENLNEGNQKHREYSLDNIPKNLLKKSKPSDDICLLNISGLWKSLGKTELFEDASMKINSNDKISLIGRNGSGKSTLLKMIIGMESIDEGEITKSKNLNIGYLSQDLFWNNRNNTLTDEMLSVFPEISSQMQRLSQIKREIDDDSVDIDKLIYEKKDIERFLVDNDGYVKYALQTDILKYFGFDAEQLNLKISQLSGGEQTKVQIAKFLIQDVDLLILDEPTNHLDIEGIMFLEKFCRLWQKALICISHDKRFIDNVFDIIVEISQKKLNLYRGNYDEYISQKQKNYDLALKNYNGQQKEIEKQEEFINRFRAKSSKASQVQSRIKMLDKVERLTPPEDELILKNIKLGLDIRLPNMILRLENLSVGYKKPIIRLPKMIEVTNDQKIGIIGKNGVGKTTLLKTILGQIQPLGGTCHINERIVLGSYSQVFENMDMDNSIIQELVSGGIGQKEVRTILGGLLITGDKVDQKIGTLSGGEKAKVALTKMLLQKPHVLIMDEPTNHLDLMSKEVIKNMLSSFGGVTLIVSHDRDLLEKISNQLWVIKDKELKKYDILDRGFDQMLDGQ